MAVETSSSVIDRDATEAALHAALREVSAQSVLFSHAIADSVGMASTDLESLDLLALHGPMPAGRLAELTGLTTGAITGLVDRLERRGYARREPHPSDRRSVIVRPLMDAALRDLAPAYTGMTAAISELMSGYSDKELAIILEFLSRATRITEEQVARVRSRAANS
jgi:DNA-binding MarR family transcriptional regulator